MSERNRGKQITQREQIEILIRCLETNQPVPKDVALTIADRLIRYLSGDLRKISQVLCRRPRSDKGPDKYDLGFIASLLAEELDGPEEKVHKATVPKEAVEALERLSDQGAECINAVVEDYAMEDEKAFLEKLCVEMIYAREGGALPEGKISASRWAKSLKEYMEY